ncbi:hypothetical protein MCOR34_008157 [Pyricularia oryzae]|nr:hypothetical protein MCOR34_008157 [Pyricularia oryzae]
MTGISSQKEKADLSSDSHDVQQQTASAGHADRILINASGHIQELPRNFSLISLAGVGVTVGNVWPAIGGSILTAIFNGGPPGVIYEFITVSVFYWCVAASIAELASAIPTAAGVYHWASVTPGSPRWGRLIGYFAGWWNYLAWVAGAASMASILGNTIVQMYALNHAEFSPQPWHVFVVYLAATWIACAAVCLANRAMPHLNSLGIVLILAGILITVTVVTAMQGRDGRPPHASAHFVWADWQAAVGYPDGFVFVAGMLNGAFSVGAVDVVTHLSEEIPQASRNVPLAMLMQVSIGFATGLAYLVAVMYAINDYDALFAAPYPIAAIYHQATGSAAAATGLLALIMACISLNVVGLHITTGRTLWALARDGAAPLPAFLGRVNRRLDVPVNATLTSGVLVTLLGVLYVGSTTAFNAFVGCFILMSSSSYLAAILPNLVTGRRNIQYGVFKLKGWVGFALNGVACAYMVVWFVIYCFPFSLPVDEKSMNYASLIWGGTTILAGLWWVFGARHGYQGPKTTGGITVDVMEADRGEVDVVPGQHR